MSYWQIPLQEQVPQEVDGSDGSDGGKVGEVLSRFILV